MYIQKVFAWDLLKSQANLSKHKVSFEDAQSVFDDPYALESESKYVGQNEKRLIRIGKDTSNRIILVVFTIRKNHDGKEIIRIISARPASKKERAPYT